jgi:transposase
MRSCRFAPLVSLHIDDEGDQMRFIGLDVHRDFCEVAICLPGERARSAGRVATKPERLRLLAESLDPEDRVVMESTSSALAIARVLDGHVAEVRLANPMQVRAISHAKVKSDRFDARTLAELFQAGMLPTVWVGDEQTRCLRRLTSRRAQLLRQRTRVKNEVSAVLVRNLAGRPAASDLFGKRGRAWLASLELPADERQTIEACLRQVDFLTEEIDAVERLIAASALHSPQIRRLMTIPGIDITAAATLMAAIGDITRFPSDRRLIGYLDLDARVRQSGMTPARYGRISKQGSSRARHVLVEAAWAAIKTPGPLRAFYRRIRARRGSQIAIVAVARKLAVLCWQLRSATPRRTQLHVSRAIAMLTPLLLLISERRSPAKMAAASAWSEPSTPQTTLASAVARAPSALAAPSPGGTITAGQLASSARLRETLPSTAERRAPRPREPTTMSSTVSRSASFMIAWAGVPSTSRMSSCSLPSCVPRKPASWCASTSSDPCGTCTRTSRASRASASQRATLSALLAASDRSTAQTITLAIGGFLASHSNSRR